MSARRPRPTDNLILVAAATILILTAQRYFQAQPFGKPHPQLANPTAARGSSFAPAVAQAGHGRDSSSPLQIPRAGWKDILWRTYVRIGEDRLLATAAGVVFFGLLAVFPAITALVSSYGLFTNPSTIGANLQTLAMMLPEGSFEIVQDQIARVLEKGDTALGATFLFGLALAIWSANAGVKAVIDALNVVYEEREKRGFVRLNLLSLAFTSGGIAALLLMVGAVVAVPLALDHLGLAPQSRLIVSLARWPLLLVILLVALGLLYRFGPSRRGTLGMARRGDAGRRAALDRGFLGAVLVPVELRKLQRDLWLTRRRHRPDDVDVDVRHHRAVRRGAELGNRAPDGAGFDGGAVKTARRPRRDDGRHARPTGSHAGKRTLAPRININAKLAATGRAVGAT
jgi:membrane protein